MDRRPIGTEKLPAAFYLQDTVEVARQLIGKRLVHRVNGQELSAIICETEAYTGFSDKACHSYKGRTERTEVMFEAGGRAYVYLIYGMYCCFNITTREAGVPEAVPGRGHRDDARPAPAEKTGQNFKRKESSFRPGQAVQRDGAGPRTQRSDADRGGAVSL